MRKRQKNFEDASTAEDLKIKNHWRKTLVKLKKRFSGKM